MPCRTRLVPLSDGAGEIAAVGEGVSRFRIGDRVTNTFLDKYQLHPVIDRVVPFAKAREAWEHFDSRHHFGKVVIRH